MSDKNKMRDRDSNGRINRKYTCNHKRLKLNSAPKEWVNIFMTRPKRRKVRVLCRRVVRSQGVECEFVFPLGNRKPHFYYL
ncbi:MAG: hypothetical protein LRY75_00420 [Shewanella xiamenensis]|nr:hypothetical protein [Shewanella xiamenensis]MCD8557300.1 hypothetical protein [Shewanella xiamenensis]